MTTPKKSKIEQEVTEFIVDMIPDVKIIHKCKHIISPYEFDIYLPDHGIAIACNPTFTHNSSIPDPWGNLPKHYKYHQISYIRI